MLLFIAEEKRGMPRPRSAMQPGINDCGIGWVGAPIGCRKRAMSVHHHVFDTAIGPCGLAWSERGLVAVQLPERDRTATERRLLAKSASAGAAAPPAEIAALAASIARYLAGERVDFSAVAVDLGSIDEFRRSLYQALREVCFGATTTYGALARRLGLEGPVAARDVGAAMGQ